MGLLDKVKQQAEQAMAKAQQGVSQGQAKLDDMQAKKRADALMRDLGAAYYAQQRHGGPADAVDSAMAALDEHVAAQGPVDTAPEAGPAAATGATSGDFKLDDA